MRNGIVRKRWACTSHVQHSGCSCSPRPSPAGWEAGERLWAGFPLDVGGASVAAAGLSPPCRAVTDTLEGGWWLPSLGHFCLPQRRLGRACRASSSTAPWGSLTSPLGPFCTALSRRGGRARWQCCFPQSSGPSLVHTLELWSRVGAKDLQLSKQVDACSTLRTGGKEEPPSPTGDDAAPSPWGSGEARPRASCCTALAKALAEQLSLRRRPLLLTGGASPRLHSSAGLRLNPASTPTQALCPELAPAPSPCCGPAGKGFSALGRALPSRFATRKQFQFL